MLSLGNSGFSTRSTISFEGANVGFSVLELHFDNPNPTVKDTITANTAAFTRFMKALS